MKAQVKPKKHTAGKIVGGVIKELSFVPRGANGRVYSLIKEQTEESDMSGLEDLLKAAGLSIPAAPAAGAAPAAEPTDAQLIADLLKADSTATNQNKVLKRIKGMWSSMTSLLSANNQLSEADLAGILPDAVEEPAAKGAPAAAPAAAPTTDQKLDALIEAVTKLATGSAPAPAAATAGEPAPAGADQAALEKKLDELTKELTELKTPAAPAAATPAVQSPLEKKILDLSAEIETLKKHRHGGNSLEPEKPAGETLSKADEEVIKLEKFWGGTAAQKLAIKKMRSDA